MSIFTPTDNLIKFGSEVVLLAPPHYVKITVVKDGKVQTRYGTFNHNDMVDLPFGSIVNSKCKVGGHVTLLYPSAELWARSLDHRTQIIYQSDISQILGWLDLKPGDRVVESGTGSGCMSHNILNAIMPTGHLYTFELDKHRVGMASAEFSKHKLGDNVTVTNTCVLAQGFSIGSILQETFIDAALLDLPQPNYAIEELGVILKPNAPLVIYLPCLQQIFDTLEFIDGLNDLFHCTKMVECVDMPYSVKVVDKGGASGKNGRKRLDKENVKLENCEMTVTRPSELHTHTAYLIMTRKQA